MLLRILHRANRRYRMYVDEVGGAHMKNFRNDNERYLSLTGIVVELDYAKTKLSIAIEDLKTSFFSEHHPDDPVILHRTDIMKRKSHFRVLESSDIADRFDGELINIFTNSDYQVITVGIDKEAHTRHYSDPSHPYHYLLEILVERYVKQLHTWNAKGDIFVESRNHNDNNTLNVEFRLFYEAGNENVSVDRVQRRLIDGKLNFKRKDQNVAGLQLADLIAFPSHRHLVCSDRGVEMDTGFGSHVVDLLLEQKYRRSVNGRIDGYGTKWLK